MLQQDYLMRMILQFAEAIRLSLQKSNGQHDPRAAAEMLEAAIGEATDIDGGILLGLAPESMVGIMQVSGTDPHLTGYIAHSLLMSSLYLKKANEPALAQLREKQARAVAFAYGITLPEVYSEADMEAFLDSQEEEISQLANS
ncbi:MAG: hypothetical protein IJJ32_01245 [Eggerthellaceae bacterium]|nr:hypothetical protein [Eggerthellaceae bacterium]